MADLDESKKNILVTIIDVYTPFLRKLLEHLKRKNDPRMQTSYDKLSYVYQIFTEGDTKEKLDVYNACQDMLEKWHKRYKDIRVKNTEEKREKHVEGPAVGDGDTFSAGDDSQSASSENSTLPIAIVSVRSVREDEVGSGFTTNDNNSEMDTSTPVQSIKIKQEKPDRTASVQTPKPVVPSPINAGRPVQAVSAMPVVQPVQEAGEKETVFVCASCQFRTTNEADFMKHARTDHRTDLSLWCKNCGKCFSNAGVLVSHIKEANCQKEEMIYRCGVKDCTFETPSGQTFVHHLRHCHKGSPFIFCVHCQKIFTLPHCLILHMQNDCPFKEKNRRNPSDKPVESTPISNTPATVPTPVTVVNNPVKVTPKSSSVFEPSKAQSASTPKTTATVKPVSSSRGRGRPGARGRYSRSSRIFEDSSESDDPDDPSWRPEESSSGQPLRRSARWASRVSEAKDPEIEPDGTIIPRSKNKSLVEPTNKIVDCPCCSFSAAFESLLKDHYIASHKSEKKNACLICNVKFENLETFVNHFSNHKKGEELTVPKDISDSSNDSSFRVTPMPEEPKSIDPPPENLKDIPVESVPRNYVANSDKQLTKIPYQTAIHQKLSKDSKIKNFEDLKSPNDIPKMKAEPKLKHFFKCTVYNCTFTTDDDKFYILHLNERHKGKKIHCSYCFQEYSEASTVVEHMFREHSKRCYQCSICFYRAFSKPHVQIHIKSAHTAIKAQVFTCSLHLPANYVFEEEEKSTEPTTFPYVCAVKECNFKTFNPKEFIKHNDLEHRSNTQFFCHYCKGDFVSLKRLIGHYHLHGINNFQCTYCVHGSETKEEILLHLCNCHADKAFKVYFRSSQDEEKNINIVKPAVKCTTPKENVKTNVGMFFRKKVTYPEEILCLDEDFFCRMPTCRQACANIDSYLKHIKEEHNTTNILCPYCSEVLADGVDFGNHMMCHGPNLYACSKEGCQWYSFQKKDFIKHVRDAHQQLGEVKIIRNNLDSDLAPFKIDSNNFREDASKKQYVCPFCYSQIADLKLMKNHIYLEFCYKRFLCLLCKEKICSRRSTKNHFYQLHAHHNIKCDVSSVQEIEVLTKSFLSQDVQENFLNYLVKGVIEGNTLSLSYEYGCNQCTSKFADTADWHYHWQHCVSKSNQPYSCNYCFEKFSNGLDLKQHTHKNHPNEPIKYTWTENEFWKQTTNRKIQEGKLEFFKKFMEPYLRSRSMHGDNLKAFKQPKYYKCGYCNFNDTFRSNIEKHIFGCHKDKSSKNVEKIKNEVRLPEASKSQPFTTSSNSVEPMDSINSEETVYVCAFCNTKTPHLVELENHVKNTHKTGDSYPFFYFPDPKWEFGKKDVELYECAYCSVSQENLFDLRRHWQNLHSDVPFKVRGFRFKDSPSVKCQYCSLKVMSQELLEKHCLFHHPNFKAGKKDEKSAIKRKRSNSSSEESTSKIKRLSSDNEYQCLNCNNTFLFYIQILVHHDAEHSTLPLKFTQGPDHETKGIDTQLISCDFCPYLSEQTLMNNHLSLKHKNCFVCSHCGVGFNTSKDLTKHSNKKHKNKTVQVIKVNNLASEDSSSTITDLPTSNVNTRDGYSYYGMKPEPVDLHNITVNLTSKVSTTAAHLPVIYLSQMFPMFPLVYVEDFAKAFPF